MLRSNSIRVDRSAAAAELLDVGFVHLRVPHDSKELAWSCARAVFHEAAREDTIGADMPPLDVVGYFNVPPPHALRRDFQALHMDFGLPVVPAGPTDVARFTALYVNRGHAPTTALTRIVPLSELLSQRTWIEPELLLERLHSYGQANTGDGGAYIEGIFARIVEAADDSPTLPRCGDADFLCGMEFDSVAQESYHFAGRGLDLDRVEQRVLLCPSQLLLLDNLATAHGRLGIRKTLELHQLCVGFRNLDEPEQVVLCRRVLEAFSSEARPRTERR
jgi:hypothetical protein